MTRVGKQIKESFLQISLINDGNQEGNRIMHGLWEERGTEKVRREKPPYYIGNMSPNLKSDDTTPWIKMENNMVDNIEPDQ